MSGLGMNRRDARVEWVLAIVVMAALLVLFFYDVVFLGKTLRASNTVPTALPSGHWGYPGGFPHYMALYDVTPALMEEPYQVFKAHSLAQGTVPLWNPHQGGGAPFLATLQSSVLYLPELVLYALPSSFGWDAYFLFRLLLAGLFTYGFARRLGLQRLSAGVAGISYMLSGPMLSWVANLTMNADLLLPLLLWLVEAMRDSPRRSTVLLGAAVVFQLLAANNPEHILFALLVTVVYALFRLAEKRRSGSATEVLGRWSVAFAGGLGLAAVALLPFIEYAFFHAWHVHGGSPGLEALGVEKAVTMIFRRWESDEVVSYAGWTFHTWPGGWIGLMPMWLGILATMGWRRGDPRTPFVLLFAVLLLKVYGFWAVNWIGGLPLFRLAKFPLHSTQAIAFCWSMLSAFAVADLEARPRAPLLFMVAAVPIGVFTLFALRAWPPSNDPVRIFTLPGVLLIAGLAASAIAARGVLRRSAFASVITALLVIELFALVPRERTIRAQAFRVPPYVEFLRRQPGPFRVYGIGGCLYPNTATAFGLDDIGIYEALFVDRFATYIHELVDNRFFAPGSFHAFRGNVRDPGSRFFDLINLKYFIVPKSTLTPPERMSALGLKLVYDAEVKIFQRLNAFPRAMIRHRVIYAAGDLDALQTLESGVDLRNKVVLERSSSMSSAMPRALLPIPADVPSDDGSRVLSLKEGINAKQLRVKMENPGIVVVSDVNYPGWTVSVDGKREDLLTANYLFQSVYVPPGDHEVRFAFDRSIFRAGLVLSVLTLLGLLAWAGLGRSGSGH
jgi:hypothetical protein